MRRIAIITGTRAEYGLLRWLIEDLKEKPNVLVQLVVTGSHLSQEHGYTYDLILNDGHVADYLVDISVEGDSGADVARSMGRATSGFAECFEQLKPDLIVVLGDRFEILSAVQVALPMRIPVAHIHGGEVTEGAIDDSIRHAVTKLSHLHFASCEEYRLRILQLGENPERVWNTGSIALDNFERLKLLSSQVVREKYCGGVDSGKLALLTYHPTTLYPESDLEILNNIIAALMENEEFQVIATEANADAGGKRINQRLHEIASSFNQIEVFASLGQVGYLSALAVSDLVIGNSSSGIVEAPSLGTPTINVGSRQDGRMKAASVIDVDGSLDSLRSAVKFSLSSEMQNRVKGLVSPFGNSGATFQISEIISTVNLEELLVKKFCDLSEAEST
jgi:UDP-N-acetylglucosamine 2-epimerase (non-hydrolysing)/GDP/UDP-N,N'-diacetylbacillosamine 2-epimerase (hydrolysing)